MSATPDHDDLIRLLGEAHERTGDGRYSTAAAMLRGNRSGRKPFDDADALKIAGDLVASGLSRRKAAALAALSTPGHSFEATRDRIRKKIGAELLKCQAESDGKAYLQDDNSVSLKG